MAARTISSFPVVIPNLPPSTPDSTNIVLTRTPDNVSVGSYLPNGIQTLSSNGLYEGDSVAGILYTPDLPVNDTCASVANAYIPANASRKADIPGYASPLIGIAPWVSPVCTLKYMKTASEDPIAALIFFLPGTGSDDPPMPNDVAWNLGDGGSWKEIMPAPVFAVPAGFAQTVLTWTSLYHGNMSNVPFGKNLTQIFDPKDYVRIYLDVKSGGDAKSPTLWKFLLIVLGVLLAGILVTSLTMRWLQKRRRQALRRRVIEGGVDLEALGIKRLTVPQSLLDQMPLYTYGTTAHTSPSKDKGNSASEKNTAPVKERTWSPTFTGTPSSVVRTSSYRPTPAEQPTCAICLDDFETRPASTTNDPHAISAEDDTPGALVRELPCRHIFHPECVDSFLRESSSLCPLCKKTVLPQGYCPRQITNAMVRRERLMRRVQNRMGNEENHPQSQGGISSNDDNLHDRANAPRNLPSPFAQNLRTRAISGLSSFSHRSSINTPANRRFSSAPLPPSSQGTEMSTVMPPTYPPPTAGSGAADSDSQAGLHQQSQLTDSNRRNWARRRAEALLGTSRMRAPLDPDAEEATRTPAWRKALRGVFPGFRR